MNVSNLSRPKPEKDSSPTRLHHQLAIGERESGQSDPNKGAPKGRNTIAGQKKNY